MITSRTRRSRLLAILAAGVFMIWVWSRNTAIVDTYRQYGAEKAVGGGSVLRPDLQRPEMHERPPEDFQDSDAHRPPNDREPPPRNDQHTDPEPPVAKPPSIDDLLHSPPAMEIKELKESPTPSSTSKTTSSVALPSPSSDPSEGETGRNPNGFGYGRIEVSVDASRPTTSAIHWSKQTEHFPISSTIQLPTGTSKPFPRIQREINKLSMYGADEDRLKVVRAAAEHSWKGYRVFAFQQDEVRPVSHRASNPFNGWGATLVDSLDTLWIMGLKKEFEEAVQAVAQIDFKTSARSDIPLFETVIRYLGGLLAAYDVSGKQHIILLDKAVELAEVLYGAFDTPNRVPMTYYRWKPSFTSEPHRSGARVILAEIGTLSLEFTRLAQLTGEPKYYDAVARLTDQFEEWQNSTRLPGMWPTYFDSSGCGRPSDSPSRTTENQHTLPDNRDHRAAPEAVAGSPDLVRHGHPGALGDDGTGKHEAEDEFYNEESHGNTWKRKRQVEDERDPRLKGEVVENGLENSHNDTVLEKVSSDSGLAGHVVENNGANDTAHEHELRAPPDANPGTITPPVRVDDTCVPKGFTSFSESSQESFTLSGMSDSMYEYLPKEYILLGGQVDKYRTMYLDSAAAVIDKLLYKPMTIDERDILLTGELRISPNYNEPVGERGWVEKFTPEGAHLACFAGGMFAVGGVIFDKPEHVEIGSKLTDGCVWMYNVTASGIMPEGAVLMKCEDTWGKCEWNETAYWAALDPYEESRTKTSVVNQRPDPPNPVPVHHAGSEDTQPRSPSEGTSYRARSEDIHRGNLDEHAHDEARDSDDTLAKRQLEVEDDDDDNDDSRRPAPPTPAGAPTPSTNQRTPVYTPPTPLSHKEFVEEVIESERLPPGFVRINSKKYILRPEAIESVFYMYRITGDPHWREVGWDMFTSIDRHTRAAFGYSAIDDITKEVPAQLDQMESFWLAETLKYFYLLYDDPAQWSLDDWVLNTEAHLFRRPQYEFAEV